MPPFPIDLDPSRIATIRLEQPGKPVVVLDHELIQRLEATLNAVPRDAAGLVLASASERAFVAGADLKAIQDLGDAALHAYLEYAARVFAMLCSFPFPTAAAVNGAALGGGLELAMHCDAVIAAASPSGKPYPVGLPEAGLSICPGWGGTNLLPARLSDPAEAIRRTATGRPLTYDEAAKGHLFDATAPAAGDLIETAKSWLRSPAAQAIGTRQRRDGAPTRWIGRPDRAAAVIAALDEAAPDLPGSEAAAAVVECVRIGLTEGWQAATAAERRHLVRLRHTQPARDAIAQFFAKSRA